jgi:hypothetical protein
VLTAALERPLKTGNWELRASKFRTAKSFPNSDKYLHSYAEWRRKQLINNMLI